MCLLFWSGRISAPPWFSSTSTCEVPHVAQFCVSCEGKIKDFWRIVVVICLSEGLPETRFDCLNYMVILDELFLIGKVAVCCENHPTVVLMVIATA